MEALASDLRWQTNLITSILTRPLTERLVLLLLEQFDSTPERQSGQAVTPRITQSTLAAMIGVSRKRNRALAALALDGSILWKEAGTCWSTRSATARGRPGVACRAAPRPAR